MAAPFLIAGTVLILVCGAAAQTIPQLVPGFTATSGFTVSTDISTLTASGQYVTVSPDVLLQLLDIPYTYTPEVNKADQHDLGEIAIRQ